MPQMIIDFMKPHRVDIDAQQTLRRILIILFQIALKPRPVEQPRQRIDVIKRDSVRSVGRRLSLKITQNKHDARMLLIAQSARNSQQPDMMICAVVLLLTVIHINLLLPAEKLLPKMRKSRQPQILRLIIRIG